MMSLPADVQELSQQQQYGNQCSAVASQRQWQMILLGAHQPTPQRDSPR